MISFCLHPLKPSSQAFVCGRCLIEELKFMISCSSTAAIVVSYQLRLDLAGSSQFDAGNHDRGGWVQSSQVLILLKFSISTNISNFHTFFGHLSTWGPFCAANCTTVKCPKIRQNCELEAFFSQRGRFWRRWRGCDWRWWTEEKRSTWRRNFKENQDWNVWIQSSTWDLDKILTY